MFKITNIEEINEKAGRKIGNEVITEVSNIVKTKINTENNVTIKSIANRLFPISI